MSKYLQLIVLEIASIRISTKKHLTKHSQLISCHLGRTTRAASCRIKCNPLLLPLGGCILSTPALTSSSPKTHFTDQSNRPWTRPTSRSMPWPFSLLDYSRLSPSPRCSSRLSPSPRCSSRLSLSPRLLDYSRLRPSPRLSTRSRSPTNPNSSLPVTPFRQPSTPGAHHRTSNTKRSSSHPRKLFTQKSAKQERSLNFGHSPDAEKYICRIYD